MAIDRLLGGESLFLKENFKFTGRLGEGAYGSVYRAVHL